MRRLLPVLAVLSLALGATVVAGCGSDDSSSSDSGSSSSSSTSTPADTGGGAATDTAASGGTAAGGDEVKVTMKDIQYDPATITVKAGTKIVWTNEDGFAHTVTSEDGPEKFDSGNVDAGGTFDFTPQKAGTINYVCQIHPNQKGVIVVQ